MKLLTMIFASVGCLLCGRLLAQEVGGLEISRSVRFQRGMFEIDASGKMVASFVYSHAHLGNIDICEDNVLLEEVETTAAQKKEFAQFVRDWKESYEQIDKRFREGINSGVSKDELKNKQDELKKQFAEVEEKAHKELRTILMPHQCKLLDQFAFRCLIRNFGISQLLKEDAVRKSLEIDGREADRIAKSIPGLKREIIRQATAAKKDALTVFLEPLTEKQKELVAQRWPHFVAEDHRVEWISIGLDDQWMKWYQEKKKDGDEVSLTRLSFQSSPSGKFVLSQFLQDTKSAPVVSRFYEFWQNEEFVKQLDLSIDQMDNLHEILEHYQRSSVELKRQLLFQQPVSSSEIELVRERVNRQLRLLAEESIRHIENELGEQRWQRFREINKSISVRSVGPLYDILHGAGSEELSLSSQQRQQIQKSALKARDSVTKSTIEIEQWLIAKVGEQMPVPSRRKLETLVGDPIDHAPLSVEMLLMFM
jgi:hypothetical protein